MTKVRGIALILSDICHRVLCRIFSKLSFEFDSIGEFLSILLENLDSEDEYLGNVSMELISCLLFKTLQTPKVMERILLEMKESSSKNQNNQEYFVLETFLSTLVRDQYEENFDGALKIILEMNFAYFEKNGKFPLKLLTSTIMLSTYFF
jgi:hypothetical protein